MPASRHNTRLAPANYLGHRSYFITICCDRRRPYLADLATAQMVLTILLHSAADYLFALHAFCAMPDHLHVLAEGTRPRSNLSEFIRLFKQYSAFEFRKSSRKSLWEKSYYDYVLRPTDTAEHIARYIWWNPVRRHLCAAPQDFPFSGSQTIPWMQVAHQVPLWHAPWKTSEPA